MPISWEPVAATVYHEDFTGVAAWSPCNKFIALARFGAVEIRDAVTLSLLNTFKSPSPTINAVLLCFSPDSSFLTQFNEGDLITWDLQTGGSVGATFPLGLCQNPTVSPAYSMDGKMLAAHYRGSHSDHFIIIHDLSTTHAHVHFLPVGRAVDQIWTHGEFLQFLTVESEYVTIWEADFTFTHPPKAVGSFPHLTNVTADGTYTKFLFLPSLSRLAIILGAAVSVLDLPDSKLLLNITLDSCSGISFSSDGRFFACGGDLEVCIFEDSSAGYILHQKFAGNFSKPLLSPNGESIIVPLHPTIHLWHTKDPFLSNSPTSTFEGTDIILQFSQNEASAAFARYLGLAVTILDLQSGDPQLVIDTGVMVESLGVTESAVIVVGNNKIVARNLTLGNHRASINDGLRITELDPSPASQFRSVFSHVSVSPDLSRIVTWGGDIPQPPEHFRCVHWKTSCEYQNNRLDTAAIFHSGWMRDLGCRLTFPHEGLGNY